MHEWALAEGVITTADRIANEKNIEQITQITVRIGELQQIEPDILRFALEQLKTPSMKDVEFTFETIPGKLRCRVCGEEWKFIPDALSKDVSEAIHFVPEMAHVYLKCPSCGSPDFEVTEGRGIWLAFIKGVVGDE